MATALERVPLAELLIGSSCSKFPNVSSLHARIFRGDRLKELRNTAQPKMSQGQLAAKIGAHVTSISDWERGANAPSGRHVASLARVFEVDAEHFYGSDDDEDPHRMGGGEDMVAVLMPSAYLRKLVREEMEAARS